MKYIKEYNEYNNINLNEEIEWRKGIFLTLAILIVSPIYMMVFISTPYVIAYKYYNKYKNNWRDLSYNIQITMDLLWTYSLKIKDIDSDVNREKLSVKDRLIIYQVRRQIIKKFGKIDISKDDIINHTRESFSKISDKKDKEIIYKLINEYNINEITDDWKIRHLNKIIHSLKIKNVDLKNDIDPFDEEEWDENDENLGNHEGKLFYYLNLKKNIMGLCKLQDDGDNFVLNNFKYKRIKKDDFNRQLNKYKNLYRPYGKHISDFIFHSSHNMSIIISHENRDIFLDIIKNQWNDIKKSYSKFVVSYHDYATFNPIMYVMNKKSPEYLLDLIDDGFNKTLRGIGDNELILRNNLFNSFDIYDDFTIGRYRSIENNLIDKALPNDKSNIDPF